MPLKKCSKDGKSGWKYGDSGHCYTGPGAKKKAIKQGIAIDGPEGFKTNAEYTEAELNEAIEEVVYFGANAFEDDFDSLEQGVLAYISKDERDKIPESDFGDPADRKYPIRNQKDLDAAVKLVGRAPPGKQATIKSRIKKIAKRKGLSLPESWS